MEQMYLIEVFIDKVSVFVSEENESGANKHLIVKIRFGPKIEFIIRENPAAEKAKDIVECDEMGHRKWTRTIRVGKSYLFPAYPDTILMILSKFPLEIEVWNDDDTEKEIFVGLGIMHWDTQFFFMLKEIKEPCKNYQPLSIKQRTALMAECCCKQCGEISFILRLSPLGNGIITEFKQNLTDPENFIFRTDKAPSTFSCRRIEGEDPNFCMVGTLYETTTLEDPDVVGKAQQKIEVCTELQSCGIAGTRKDVRFTGKEADKEQPKKKIYPIDKIRMGDIVGPCGNTNCPLAHKVRNYIRNLDVYKQAGNVTGTKIDNERKICGTCDCKEDRWHREMCQEKDKEPIPIKVVCTDCGGKSLPGATCKDNQDAHFGTGATPKSSKHNFEPVGPNTARIGYVLSITRMPEFKQSKIGTEFTMQNLSQDFFCNLGYVDMLYQYADSQPSTSIEYKSQSVTECSCRKKADNTVSSPNIHYSEDGVQSGSTLKNPCIFNVTRLRSKHITKPVEVYNYTETPINLDDKECKCNPPKPTPPCRTFDCECLAEAANRQARKIHKPYCPSYKHKANCPVNALMNEEEGKQDEDEDKIEPLPYGLPPVKLGPCPVIGKPCTYPDGFQRMYKTAAMSNLPPSYSEAGKVCCSKEYERIKKAIKEYMTYEKDHDFRCINKFNVDTERRCCDKEQTLLSLMGKACCGSHKLALQEKFQEEKLHNH